MCHHCPTCHGAFNKLCVNKGHAEICQKHKLPIGYGRVCVSCKREDIAAISNKDSSNKKRKNNNKKHSGPSAKTERRKAQNGKDKPTGDKDLKEQAKPVEQSTKGDPNWFKRFRPNVPPQNEQGKNRAQKIQEGLTKMKRR